MKQLISLFCMCTIIFSAYSQSTYYVSPLGDNNNDGSISSPWLTIQYAVSMLNSGDELFIREGIYNGKIDITQSGSFNAPIRISNYQNETVEIVGNDLENYEYLLQIIGQEYISISGLHFKNYQKLGAVGIRIINSSYISILNNYFLDIDYSETAQGEIPNETQNSQPIIVYGRDPENPITDLKINGNTIYNCELGYSEALSVNGNVDGFEIIENTIYNNTNIGIVAIGHEGECSDPLVDQARNGIIKHNLTYNNLSPYAAAGGIYVDGGKSIIVENNVSYNNNYGIEIGCENNGNAPSDPSAKDIVVRNNFIYNNTVTGLAIGGYNYPTTGKVEDIQITNNTCFNNDTTNTYTGEFTLSYTENCSIENNIFYTTNNNNVLYTTSSSIPTVNLDYNVYYTSSATNAMTIEIDGTGYYTFQDYLIGSGKDLNSIFGNPQFENENPLNPDLHIQETSLAINAGNPNFVTAPNEVDIDGELRLQGTIVDCGADETSNALSLVENKVLITLYVDATAKTLKFSNQFNGSKYCIYTLSGQKVKEDILESSSIDVSLLETGMYVLQLHTDKSIHHFKFILR